MSITEAVIYFGLIPLILGFLIWLFLGMLFRSWLEKQGERLPAGRKAQKRFWFEKKRAMHNARVHDPGQVSDSICAACDSKFTEPIAEGVYRCRRCDYTGGPGYADYAATKQAAALQSKPMEERIEAASSILQDTLLSMTALEGNIEAAVSASKLDVSKLAGFGDIDDIGEAEKRQELYEIQEELTRINGNIELAARTLGEDLSALMFDIDMSFMLSERRDRWTKQERGYTRKHEQEIHKEIIAMSDDFQHAKRKLKRKVAELGSPNYTPNA